MRDTYRVQFQERGGEGVAGLYLVVFVIHGRIGMSTFVK